MCGWVDEPGEDVAEEGRNSGQTGKKHTSGAKARRLLCGIYGTTEVVP
jgi:hypothetical protein